MIGFREIIESRRHFILDRLSDGENYFAHKKSGHQETLKDHSELVLKYFIDLIEKNKFEYLFDKIINKYLYVNNISSTEKVASVVKDLFFYSIYFHDIGKINPMFQFKKMENPFFNKHKNIIGTDHSPLSMYLYLSYFYNMISRSEYEEQQKSILFLFAAVFSHSINKHHGILSNVLDLNFNVTLIDSLNYFYELFNNTDFLGNEIFNYYLSNKDGFIEFNKSLQGEFTIFFLVKINSSLLTAADYLATNHFMLNLKISDYGIIESESREKIIQSISSIDYNKNVLNNLNFNKDIIHNKITTFSNYNLNLLRENISYEVIKNYRKNKKSNLFYVEAPTGSGKTNISMLLISEILKTHPEKNKVFYVYPFISLITQTKENIKSGFKLNDDEIAEIHSKSGFNYKNESDEDYGDIRKNYIDSLFVFYPFVLLSHIKFFDILVSNEKESNYLLHRLPNSVVILDEVQSYDPEEWDKITYLLQHYSESLNITFILMSATLPKIGKLASIYDKDYKDRYCYLVDEPGLIFKNPNFSKRVRFNFEILDNENFEYSEENLSEMIFDKMKKYKEKHGGCTALIELNTKKGAKALFDYISTRDDCQNINKILINGTIIQPRRNEIIKFIKNYSDKSELSLIIGTQVIEAGLDIDVDLGFKDKSILDSEEQFAGRVKRNARKSESEIFLFDSGNAKYVYKNDLRFRLNRNIEPYYKNILETKEFNLFYDIILNNIKEYNQDRLALNLSYYIKKIKNLDLWEVIKNFNLIKENALTVYVPLNIKLDALESNHINTIERLGINVSSGYLSGMELWDNYKNIANNNSSDFIIRKAEIKLISSLLSQFCFSIYRNQNNLQLLKHYGEEELGYFFLYNWESIYSYQNGLENDLESNCNIL